MSWNELLSDTTVASRQLLRSFGATDRMLTAAVRFGHLVRARRDHYVLPICPPDVISAVRVGGRLGCVSALRAAGVFAVLPRHPHVHVDPDASRCRSAQSVRVPLPT
ncbi:MAG: hypothetical protein LH471_03055, partial [Salinibacterium sp.]|nr:hypothetical protein [Salinibacterium sp.]